MDITWPWPGGRGEMMFQDIHLSSILHFPVKEGVTIKVVNGGEGGCQHDECAHKLFVI